MTGKIQNEARHRHHLGIAQFFQIVFLRCNPIDIFHQTGGQIILRCFPCRIVEKQIIRITF